MPWWQVVLIVCAAPVAIAAGFLVVLHLLAAVSGWRALAARHRAERTEGEGVTPGWASVGIVSYRGGLLTLVPSKHHLGLRVSVLSWGHPPLQIPWAAVQERSRSRWPLVGEVLTFDLDGTTTLRLPAACTSGWWPRPDGE